MEQLQGRVDSGTVGWCPRCYEATEHETSIRIRENARRSDVRAENEKFTRRPHLVRRCSRCGRSTAEVVA